MGSFPLIGNETITCERNDSFTPPRGYWDMGEFQSYCLSKPYSLFSFMGFLSTKNMYIVLLKTFNVVLTLAENPCDTLPAPENGAISCATWLFGMQCQMQCSGQYDIPYGIVGSNGAPFTGLFTCSESLGVYTPSNTVPGCTRMQYLYIKNKRNQFGNLSKS